MKKCVLLGALAVLLAGCGSAGETVPAESAVESAAESAIESAEESAVESSVESEVDSSVESAVEPAESDPVLDGDDRDNLKEGYDHIGWVIEESIRIVRADPHEGTEKADPFVKSEKWKELSAEQLEVYRELEEKAGNFEPFCYTADEYGYDYLDTIYAVMPTLSADRPDIDIYFMTEDVFEGTRQTALRSAYVYPGDSSHSAEDDLTGIREACAYFEEVADRFVAGMPEDFSDYDKYRYLATVISLQTTYDYYGYGGLQVGNAYGAILGGWSICEGYSTGFKYLCSKADLYCTRVSGVFGRESHMWNGVKLDDKDYYIDITWSDDESAWPDTPEWKRYFMVTREFLENEAGHQFWYLDE